MPTTMPTAKLKPAKRIKCKQTLATLITEIEVHLHHCEVGGTSIRLLRDALPHLKVIQTVRDDIRKWTANHPDCTGYQG